MSAPVALILGAGKGVGASVARILGEKGYRVAITSRTQGHNLSQSNYTHLTCDLEDPNSVKGVFDIVKRELGTPSVVVYNAAMMKLSQERTAPLDLSLSDLQATMNVNFFSVYTAAQQAVASFEAGPLEHPKAFIYTGNALNTTPLVPLLSLGVGKTATAHLIAYLSKVYKDKSFGFYFADERQEDGQPVYSGVDGPAHADFYAKLIDGQDSIPWWATFVKGHGYKHFPDPPKVN